MPARDVLALSMPRDLLAHHTVTIKKLQLSIDNYKDMNLQFDLMGT